MGFPSREGVVTLEIFLGVLLEVGMGPGAVGKVGEGFRITATAVGIRVGGIVIVVGGGGAIGAAGVVVEVRVGGEVAGEIGDEEEEEAGDVD